MSAAWFAIIDGAQDERLKPLVEQCRESECMYAGDLDSDVAAVAPWIVRISDQDPLLPIWQEHGRGKFWGIMLESDLPMKDLRRQFRRNLQAKLPDGTIALFRFYDPRVFNTYIRAASPEERAPWFDGVSQYAVEGEDGVTHQYRLSQGRLMDGADVVG